MGFFNKWMPNEADAEKYYQQAFEEETEHNNYEKALSLYEKAAKHGLAKAQYYSGYMYLKGRGARRDKDKALTLIKQAADQNHPHAQYLLAQMYLSGEGVDKCEKSGNEWMEKYRVHKMPENLLLSFNNY